MCAIPESITHGMRDRRSESVQQQYACTKQDMMFDTIFGVQVVWTAHHVLCAREFCNFEFKKYDLGSSILSCSISVTAIHEPSSGSVSINSGHYNSLLLTAMTGIDACKVMDEGKVKCFPQELGVIVAAEKIRV